MILDSWMIVVIGGVAAVVGLPLLYIICVNAAFANRERADQQHTVKTDDGWGVQVFRYTPKSDGRGEPILLCHGAFANHHNFDIPSGGSMAEYLSEAGYDCWLMDYRGDKSSKPATGKSRRSAEIDDYITEDIPAVIDFILNHTGYAELHAVGHSLGGMLLYAYDLEFQGYGVASLTTIGSPIDFGHLPKRRHTIAVWFLGTFPWLTRPIHRAIVHFMCKLRLRSKYFPINWKNIPNKFKTNEMLSALDLLPKKAAQQVDRWAATNEWTVLNGEMDVAAELPELHAPLFAVYARKDGLTPIAKVTEFFESIQSDDKRMIVLPPEDGECAAYDHIDLVFGPDAAKDVFDPVKEWIEIHPANLGSKPPVPFATPPVEPAGEKAPDPAPAPEPEAEAAPEREAEPEAAAAPAPKRKLKLTLGLGSKKESKKKPEEELDQVQKQRHSRVMSNLRAALDDAGESLDPGGEGLPGTELPTPKVPKGAVEKTAARKKKAKKKSPAKKSAAKKTAAKSKTKAKPKKKSAKKPAAKKKSATNSKAKTASKSKTKAKPKKKASKPKAKKK